MFTVFPPHFPGHGETLIFDIVKNEWSVAITSPPSSITTNKVLIPFHATYLAHLVLFLFSYCVN